MSQPSTLWTVIGSNYDYILDQQTGVPSGDIVGLENDPGFFTAFDEGSTESLTDGHLAFRVRLDDHDGPAHDPSFERQIWVGIDADLNGAIDLYVGVEGTGNANNVVLHAPGDTANNSPGSISISNEAYVSYDLDLFPEYGNHRAVSESDYVAWDGSLNSLDLTGGGSDTDYYISFQLPFSDIVEFLSDPVANAGNTMSIDEDTPLQYIVMSATQGNVVNQDFGGVNESDPDYNPDDGWDSQPGTPLSPPMTAPGVVVPEPSSCLLAALGMTLGLCRRRR